MKTTRIDQYICIDTDQVMVDEMTEIIEMEIDKQAHAVDKADWKELQAAARVILKNYSVGP